MKKSTMFVRMITASLMRRRSRMVVALLSIAIGATVLSGLVTIYYDVPRQMGAQFRNYGANMILTPSGDSMTLDDVAAGAACIPSDQLVGMTPYRYETVRIRETPVVAAGTDLESAKKTSPFWSVEGEWPSANGELLLGAAVAEQYRLKVGDTIEVTYTPEELADASADPATVTADEMILFDVTGILDTGGSEEEYVYLSMEDLNGLTGGSDKLDVVELSVSADQSELKQYGSDIENNVDDVTPRLVKRVTESESTVLTKLQALVFLVTAVVLVLTMICVATTMTAAVTERRKEIGLRKALGASNRSIIGEFMGEGLLLGGVGGLIGAGLGFAFAQAVSMKVFNSSITFQPLLLPVTIVVSVLVAGCACLLPVKSATEVDPAVVLKGE